MKFSPSNNHDRECLFAVTGRVSLEAVRESHAAMDDTGEWATANAESLRLGLADARLQRLADEERAKVLRERLGHIRHDEALWRRQHDFAAGVGQGRTPEEMAANENNTWLLVIVGAAGAVAVASFLAVTWLAPLWGG